MKHFIEIYKDKNLEYRWKLKSYRNKKVMADSGEGYKTLQGCKKAVNSVNYGNLEIVVL
jgi:uncharacterized protein YegP (UPF0339 family)